jgi:hypothetical protein
MKPNTEILEELLQKIDRFPMIREEDVPDISLYMDQVTTFMDDHLSENKRRSDDKALTKTMINNYAKNRLLPSPEKKKYSKDHMLLLIFIYYYKNLVSLSDIETLFRPLTEKHFGAGPGTAGLDEIYSRIFSLVRENTQKLKPEIRDKYSKAAGEMKDLNCPEDEREYLTLFAFVSELVLDVYAKKQMIEQIADVLAEESGPARGKHK